MSLLDLVDHIMHTTPAPARTIVRLGRERDLRSVHRQIDRLQRSIAEQDAAVAVAEARLRARGVVLPGDDERKRAT